MLRVCFKSNEIRVFSLFLLLFMGLIIFFDHIYESHCTILLTFFFFSKKFSVSVK